MKNLLHLNKLIVFLLISLFSLCASFAEDETRDIWKSDEISDQEITGTKAADEVNEESPIFTDESNDVVIKINDNLLDENNDSVIGIFDPEENNFNLNMWSNSDGEDIKKILKRINKIKLSKASENLLFKILFTNAYSPQKNLDSQEFLKIKIDWLIKNKRIDDLELLLKNNSEVGQNSKAVKFLINEYLSDANIKSACDKINFIDLKGKNDYLEKFNIYCLINNGQKDEAQLNYDLLKERGFKDKFYENKINFLLGLTNETNQKILDNDLFNFYLSHITSNNFLYLPTDKTNKYIWRYLSSANLIEVNNLENEEIILTYEQAAAQNSFDTNEIFKIYLRMNFNFNQLLNAEEIYKTMPSYKARGLIYQKILLNTSTEEKIVSAFLLKDLFIKDKILNIYKDELSSILKSLDPSTIPDEYAEVVAENLENKISKNIKFDNDTIHKSKIIKHFLNSNQKISKTEKDFKSVYKKIKKNKKYFVSIKDIVVLESLAADGVALPKDLDYSSLSSQLTIPNNLQELVSQNQLGLVMLKIVEVIGEDNIEDLDPETVYFLSKILNSLNLKKIRNSILREALPTKV